MKTAAENAGIAAISESAVLVGFPKSLGKQALFSIGLLVESDSFVNAAFRQNLDAVLRSGEDPDVFQVMHETIATFTAAELHLIRRRTEHR